VPAWKLDRLDTNSDRRTEGRARPLCDLALRGSRPTAASRSRRASCRVGGRTSPSSKA